MKNVQNFVTSFFFSQCLLLCTVSERVHALRRAPYQNSETGTPVNGSPDKDFEFSLPVFIGRENELQYWLKAARRRSASAGLNFIFLGIRRFSYEDSNPAVQTGFLSK